MASEVGVAIAQLNLVVGDLEGNVEKIVEAAAQARTDRSCRFIVYPELSICGYPPEDLLLRDDFLSDCETAMLKVSKLSAAEFGSALTLAIGHPHREGGKLYNAASFIQDGLVLGTYCKRHLPNYGVFDERRYFAAGEASCVLAFDGLPIGVTICEDIWADGPVECTVEHGAKLIFNLNGSPFDVDKPSYRETGVVGRRARSNSVPIVYVNLVGGQDELVFDGGSFVADADGTVVARLPMFEECVRVVVFDAGLSAAPKLQLQTESKRHSVRSYAQIHLGESGDDSAANQKRSELLSGIYGALKLGVADYVCKNGFESAVVAVSGGVDSALTLAIVADALGADRVQAVSMPSRHTQQISIDDALSEADALGVQSSVIPIDPIFDSVLAQLADEFDGLEPDVTEENIQARCRGMVLMAISNKRRAIVITTGNKSEVAVGYATLYGDMAGGFAAIKDVPKTMVYELAEYRNVAYGDVIPSRVLTRPPTAELAEDQRDDDSLPPYHVLDPILKAYVEEDLSVDRIADMGYELETVKQVAQLVKRNEYKRKQAAPGVRISLKAFGRDRRFPITNQY